MIMGQSFWFWFLVQGSYRFTLTFVTWEKHMFPSEKLLAYAQRCRISKKKVRPSDNSSKSEPILMNLFLKDFDFIFVRLSSKMSKIGSLDPEILAKKWSKSGKIEVSERFFEKISRNMTDTEKMLQTLLQGIGLCVFKKKIH